MNLLPPAASALRPARLALVAATALLAAAPALADDDEIRTDRPDFVESAATVGRGRFQIETGVEYTRDTQDGIAVRARATPTLLRYGIADRLELRLETEGAVEAKVRDAAGVESRTRGTADAALGVKWQQQPGDEKAGRPAIAWLFHVDLPSGSGPLRGHGARPSLRAVAEWELPFDASLGVMPGVAVDHDDQGRRFAAGILAATIGKEWLPGWSTFVEVAGRRLAKPSHGGNEVTFDLGTTYLLAKNIQLDLSYSRALTSETPDKTWAAGVSVRF